MLKRKTHCIAYLVLLLLLATEQIASASLGDVVKEAMKEGFWAFLADTVTDFTQGLLQTLQVVLYTPTELNKIFQLSQYVHYAQILAGVWLTFVLSIRGGLSTYLPGVYGEVSMGELIERGITGYAMIYITPWMIESFMLPINNWICEAILSFDITDDPTKVLLSFLDTPTPLADMVSLTVIMLLFGIALCFSAAIRYAEIMGFFIFSPIIATSIAYKGDLFNVFMKELTAVVFSQVWQVTCAYLFLGLLTGQQGWLGHIYGFGVMWVAIKGPTFLKGWAYYSSGVGKSVMSAGGNAARMAIYKGLMKP